MQGIILETGDMVTNRKPWAQLHPHPHKGIYSIEEDSKGDSLVVCQ